MYKSWNPLFVLSKYAFILFRGAAIANMLLINKLATLGQGDSGIISLNRVLIYSTICQLFFFNYEVRLLTGDFNKKMLILSNGLILLFLLCVRYFGGLTWAEAPVVLLLANTIAVCGMLKSFFNLKDNFLAASFFGFLLPFLPLLVAMLILGQDFKQLVLWLYVPLVTFLYVRLIMIKPVEVEQETKQASFTLYQGLVSGFNILFRNIDAVLVTYFVPAAAAASYLVSFRMANILAVANQYSVFSIPPRIVKSLPYKGNLKTTKILLGLGLITILGFSDFIYQFFDLDTQYKYVLWVLLATQTISVTFGINVVVLILNKSPKLAIWSYLISIGLGVTVLLTIGDTDYLILFLVLNFLLNAGRNIFSFLFVRREKFPITSLWQ